MMIRNTSIAKLAVCAVMCVVAAFSAGAQNSSARNAQIMRILEKSRTNRVSLTYSCTVSVRAPITLDGTLLIQGDCYIARGNGLSIFCDGVTRWTVDAESKEVYIEQSSGLQEILEYKDSLSRLDVSDIKYMPMSKDTGIFTFDSGKLDSSWIVTDLRTE